MGDWAPWAELRTRSRTFLSPWEPSWPQDVLSRGSFRRRLRRHARDHREDTGYAFFIFRQSDAALIGGLTLSNVRRGVTQSASLGYWVGEPHARQGHMHDAITALVPWAFDVRGLHRLEAACLVHNVASAGLLRKCGFSEEGIAREYHRINGRWQDHRLYAMLETDARPEPP